MDKDELKKFKFIQLHCPWMNWHDELVQKYYVDMVSLKKAGYEREYQKGVLPIDATDQVCDHLLIAMVDDNGDEKIISGAKTISTEAASFFHLPFTLSKMLQAEQASDHIEVVNQILENSLNSYNRVGYYSSWTIEPSIRKTPATPIVKELFNAGTYLFHNSLEINQLFGLGVPKHRTQEVFYKWGYSPIKDNMGNDLSNLHIGTYDDVEVIVLFLEKFSQELAQFAESYKFMWENRLELGEPFVRHLNRTKEAA